MIIGTGALEPGAYTAHCLFDGQPGILERYDSESATAYILPAQTAQPAQTATSGEPVAVPVSRIERLIARDQPRSAAEGTRFPAPAAYGESVRPALLGDPGQALTDAVRRAAPEGWPEIAIDVRALGVHVELTAIVTAGDATAHWLPPREVAEWLRRLRECAYTPSEGTWTSLTFRLGQDGQPSVEYGYGEPAWFGDDAETGQACYDELRYLPRANGADQWLLEPAWQHHTREHPKDHPQAQPMRMAKVFDGARADGAPEVYRPVLSRFEAEDVVRYLLAGYPVLEARSQAVDEVEPERGAQVPKAYLTDGTWVWPVAIAYYLGEHAVTPERDLLAHIRGRGYQAPEEVADFAVEQAKAMVLGTDVESLAASTRDGILGELRLMIASHGISRRFYSLEGPVAGGWNMMLADDGWWEVAYQPPEDDAGSAVPKRFTGIIDAATYLLGSLLRNQPDYQRQPGEPLEDFECPWGVMLDELALSALDAKHMDDLPEGAEIDRFGTDEGNLAFPAGTTLPQRGIPQNQQPGQYRRYRVQAPFGAVIGTVRGDAEGSTVGGGTAYVLPQSLRELVAGGWITEL